MKYKVICSDLDGTLLDSESRLSPENAEAISELAKRGIIFVPTTGRTILELPDAIREHKDVRYFIYSNGAGIYDAKEDKAYEYLLSPETVGKLLEIFKKYKVMLFCHKDRGLFMDDDEFPNYKEYKIWKSYLELFRVIPPELRLHNFWDFLKNSGDVEMIVGFFGKEEKREAECRAELEKIPGIHVTSSADGNIEIVNGAANKGNAVRRLSELLGISTDEFITAGDSINDVEMLELAGLSLAVSGAKPATKAAADKIICSNDEHIAKYILENII